MIFRKISKSLDFGNCSAFDEGVPFLSRRKEPSAKGNKIKPKNFMKIEPIIKVVIINAPASKVWAALTEGEQLAKWFHASDDYTGEIDKTFHMDVVYEGKNYMHTLTIKEKEDEKKLGLEWHIAGDPGNTYVTYELTPEGAATKVTVTHSGFDALSLAKDAIKSREGYNGGWEHVLFSLLKPYVETGKADN